MWYLMGITMEEKLVGWRRGRMGRAVARRRQAAIKGKEPLREVAVTPRQQTDQIVQRQTQIKIISKIKQRATMRQIQAIIKTTKLQILLTRPIKLNLEIVLIARVEMRANRIPTQCRKLNPKTV